MAEQVGDEVEFEGGLVAGARDPFVERRLGNDAHAGFADGDSLPFADPASQDEVGLEDLDRDAAREGEVEVAVPGMSVERPAARREGPADRVADRRGTGTAREGEEKQCRTFEAAEAPFAGIEDLRVADGGEVGRVQASGEGDDGRAKEGPEVKAARRAVEGGVAEAKRTEERAEPRLVDPRLEPFKTGAEGGR